MTCRTLRAGGRDGRQGVDGMGQRNLETLIMVYVDVEIWGSSSAAALLSLHMC